MSDCLNTDTPLLESYERDFHKLDAPNIDWLSRIRRDGLARYCALGLPGPRNEAWKYTNLRRLGRTKFVSSLALAVPVLEKIPRHTPEIEAINLVLVNGRFCYDLSDIDELPDGVSVTNLSDAFKTSSVELKRKINANWLNHDMPMLALNSAYLNDGLVLEIASDANLDVPIHLIFLGITQKQPVAFHPRVLMTLRKGVAAKIYESHIGLGGTYLSNGATVIHVGEEALLQHYKLQKESDDAYHVATSSADIAESGTYENFTLHVGGLLVRNEIHAVMNGKGAECRLYGAYAGHGNQHIDTTTFVDHAVPECTSREVYKGALNDNSRGVFQGKILVRKDAQKSDGHQLNKALLLSENAEIDAKPELEIYADDVKCSHGATAGALDEEQLFYLRTRGIEESTAKDLLVAAFMEESLEVIGDENSREVFRNVLTEWLAMHRGQQED